MVAAGEIRCRHSNQWWHPVALSEAPDVLHRAMRPVSYRRIRMAASKSPAFFVVIILLFEHNLSLRQWYGQHKLKQNYIILCKVLINLFICYGLCAPTVNDGCRFDHHFQ